MSLAKILYKCKYVGETENDPVADPGHYADYSASLTFPDPQKHLGWWKCHIRPDWVSIGICICIFLFYWSQFICISNPQGHLDQQTC